MAKILCVLYDDPTDGQPTTYARDDLPVIDHYPGGQTTPTPEGTDFTPAICWAASPVNSASAPSWRAAATPSSSRPTRKARDRSSTANWSTRTS